MEKARHLYPELDAPAMRKLLRQLGEAIETDTVQKFFRKTLGKKHPGRYDGGFFRTRIAPFLEDGRRQDKLVVETFAEFLQILHAVKMWLIRYGTIQLCALCDS